MVPLKDHFLFSVTNHNYFMVARQMFFAWHEGICMTTSVACGRAWVQIPQTGHHQFFTQLPLNITSYMSHISLWSNAKPINRSA